MTSEFWRFTKSSSMRRREDEKIFLGSLGLPLKDKRVLELGCGIGLMSSFWERRYCNLFSTDGREENIAELLHWFPYRKGEVETIDFDEPNSHIHLGKFDIVFAWDCLGYASNISFVIADLAQVCDELFLIQLNVWPIDNGLPNYKRASKKITASLHGVSCNPARDWMMRTLKKYFRFVYVPSGRPAHPEYPERWPSCVEGGGREATRAIFVASRKNLDLSTLSDKL